MPPRIAKLAGLGALGAAAGLMGLYLLFVLGTRGSGYSGMDETTRALTWLAVGGVFVALAAVHVMFGRKLLAIGKGERDEI